MNSHSVGPSTSALPIVFGASPLGERACLFVCPLLLFGLFSVRITCTDNTIARGSREYHTSARSAASWTGFVMEKRCLCFGLHADSITRHSGYHYSSGRNCLCCRLQKHACSRASDRIRYNRDKEHFNYEFQPRRAATAANTGSWQMSIAYDTRFCNVHTTIVTIIGGQHKRMRTLRHTHTITDEHGHVNQARECTL